MKLVIMYKKRLIDMSTILGISLSFAIVIFAIANSNNRFSSFFDFPSVLIVIFGTFFVTLACFSTSEVIKAVPVMFDMITHRSRPLNHIAVESIKYAEFARNSNVIQLEDKLNRENNSTILSKGVSLINQSEKLENIEKILNQEIITYAEEKENIVMIIRKAAEISPAMGLIGTLIGLVQMLGNLSDPSNLGPSMATALLTTFYGSMMAYIVFFPIASKIERNSKDETVSAQIHLKTVISIAINENPRYLENVINSLLCSSGRINYYR